MAQLHSSREHSASPPARNFKCVERSEYVHDSRRGDEPRAVIPRGPANVGTGSLEKARQKIKYPGPSVRQKSHRAERVFGMRRENISAHQVANDHKASDRAKKSQCPAPSPQQRVPKPRNQELCECKQRSPCPCRGPSLFLDRYIFSGSVLCR